MVAKQTRSLENKDAGWDGLVNSECLSILVPRVNGQS